MDNRKISDLTVEEFKALMNELFEKHDPIARENKRQFEYANRHYIGPLVFGNDPDKYPFKQS